MTTNMKLAAVLILGLGSASVGYARTSHPEGAVTTQGARRGVCRPPATESCFVVDDYGTVFCVCVGA
jgi:hypothetical protein